MANYVRSKIREKAKERPVDTRARACAKLAKQATELADLLVDHDSSGAIEVLRGGCEQQS